MRAHILENGVIVNTVEVDSLDALENLVDASNGGSIGDSLQDGQWVKPPQATEELEAAIRSDRDARLAASDWVTTRAVDQNAQDSLGIQVPQVWATYRQGLRDITAQDSFPQEVTWPEKPA
tara:strand:- start:575 stop:937 length:363 start_codon:yes stop_codon:yes gene_type:complete